jgi:hypothetical protein
LNETEVRERSWRSLPFSSAFLVAVFAPMPAFLKDSRLLPSIMTGGLGLWLCWLGVRMPRPTGWASSPGLFPVIIGVGLIVLALLLLLERRRLLIQDRDARQATDAAPNSLEVKIEELTAEPAMSRDGMRRTVLVTGLIIIYAISLRFLPFEVATLGFLIAGMLAFGERSVWKIALASIGATLVIDFAFIYGLGSLLPGNGGLLERFLFGG